MLKARMVLNRGSEHQRFLTSRVSVHLRRISRAEARSLQVRPYVSRRKAARSTAPRPWPRDFAVRYIPPSGASLSPVRVPRLRFTLHSSFPGSAPSRCAVTCALWPARSGVSPEECARIGRTRKKGLPQWRPLIALSTRAQVLPGREPRNRLREGNVARGDRHRVKRRGRGVDANELDQDVGRTNAVRAIGNEHVSI